MNIFKSTNRAAFLLLLLAFAPTTTAAQPFVVIIQPIITQSDTGHNPAPMRIEEKIIDNAFANAKIDFHFLDPIYFNNTKARDGKINLDQIINIASKQNILKRPKSVLNMFFVNAVDGKPGPLGRAKTPGWITFIAQGNKPNPDQDAFVIAHEASHNLGLKHAVDDPNVPNDKPNLQGEGPFKKRLGKNALNDYQIKIIQNNPLVKLRIWCLPVDEGKAVLADHTYEPFFDRMQQREIYALTGQPATGDTPQQWQADALKRFQDSVLPFTDDEIETVKWYVQQTEKLMGKDYPLLSKHPWRFIKLKDRLCGGFPHTRSLSIFYSQRILQTMKMRKETNPDIAIRAFAPLYVHEQLHVLERVYPDRFAKMYESLYGLKRSKIEGHPWIDQNQIVNPDAIKYEWVFPVKQTDKPDKYYYVRTLLRLGAEKPRMGYDFINYAFELKHIDERHFKVITDEDDKPTLMLLTELKPYIEHMPTPSGLDHPNEQTSYLMGQIMAVDYFAQNLNPDQQQRANQLRIKYKPYKEALQQILR